MDEVEEQRIRQRLERLRARKHELELQKASFGLHCPPHILLDLDDAKKEITDLKQELLTFSPQTEGSRPELKAQVGAEAAIATTFVSQQVYRVGVYSQSAQEPESVLDYRLDFQSHFPNGVLPTPQVWEREFIPQLKQLRDKCNQHPSDTIKLSPHVHISLGIALGTFFTETTPSTLLIHQFNRVTGQWEWWSSRAKPALYNALQYRDLTLPTNQQAIDEPLLFDLFKRHFDLNDLQDLCFKLAVRYEDISGNTLSAKVRELIVYMRQRNRLAELQQALSQERPHIGEELHIATSTKQQISLELASARSLAAVGGDAEKAIKRLQLPITRRMQVGISDISDESHALSVAKQIRKFIVDQRDEGYRQPIHLFAAIPIGLAVMLGCQLNACGPIQLYEYNKDGDKSYYPAWRYNS